MLRAESDFIELVAFGKRLRRVRRRLKLRQKDFAEKLQASTSYLSEIENGKAIPNFYFLKMVIDEFNINPLYLFTKKFPMIMRENNIPKSNILVIKIREDKKDFQELIDCLFHIPEFRYAALDFFSNYLLEHKELIDYELSQIKEEDENPQ